MSTKTIAAKLTAEIRLTAANQIEVHYRLKNETNGELCIFNKLYWTKPSGERVLDPNMTYVIFEDERTIHITRSAIDIPPGLKVEYPEVPYVSILGAGKEIEEKIILPIPIHEVHPYREPLERGQGKEHDFKQVYFSIGVLPKSPELPLKSILQSGQAVFAVPYGDALNRQYLIKTPRTNLTVVGLTDTAASHSLNRS